MKRLISILLIALLFSACNAYDPDKAIVQGEEEMERILLTKEEFIKLIGEKEYGVSLQDFDTVDICDFIFKYKITQEYMEELILVDSSLTLTRLLEWYIEDMPNWEKKKQMAPYLVRELKYVDSTDEEYEDFIDSYFKELQLNSGDMIIVEGDVLTYRFETSKGKWLSFNFCQTSKSKKLPISKGEKNDAENYTIRIPVDKHMSYYRDIHYSKSGKYLMFLDGNSEYGFGERLNLIKTFCELED